MKTLLLIIKWIWNTINFVRKLVLNILFFIVLFAVFAAISLFNEESAPQFEHYRKQALTLDLAGPIVEQKSYQDPLDSLSGNLSAQDIPREYVLYDIVETIRFAIYDDSITALVLRLDSMPETNLTKLRYIAKALLEFKASGKKIYAYGDMYNQSQYYLASYADEVFMSPDGLVMIKGYSNYNLYYKDFLDKIKVTTHIFKVGTYKSAVEPFMRNDMSEDAKASATIWLSQLWGAYVSDVANNRNIEKKTLTPDMKTILAMVEAAQGDMAKLAIDAGLVDELKTHDQMAQYFIDLFGQDSDLNYRQISYDDYASTLNIPHKESDNKIAVIVAKGTILDGEQPAGTIGGDTLSAQLRQARLDDEVKAVVLRIDSPGGSAFASEVVRQEIVGLKATGKPIVVSMSSMAASGGYWIAMPADIIIAQPTTLTGSIGIFSVIPTVEKGLAHLGIYSNGIGTSPFSGSGFANGINDDVGKIIQMNIEHGYKRFTSLVSTHRDISLENVDRIAQGRVWTGADALERNLVDQLGDFDDAIDAAVKLAQLDSYELIWIEQEPTPLEQFMQTLSAKAITQLGVGKVQLPVPVQEVLSELNASTKLLNNLNDPKGFYSFCLTCQVE